MEFDRTEAERWLAYLRKHVKPSIKYLDEAVGGLSKPGKLPWYSYSIPAEHCKVGSKLRKVRGSVCASCYATKGRYRFPNVAEAMERRYRILMGDVSRWAANMVLLLDKKSRGKLQYFRWHDSGDVQNQAHLDAIVWIAKQLPHIRFWLPTKEYKLVADNVDVLADDPNLQNLVVRISNPGVRKHSAHPRLPTSSVGAKVGYECPARLQNNKCETCRACWARCVPNVDYELH